MAGDLDILVEGKLLSLRLRELEHRIKAKEATNKDVIEYKLKLKRKNELEGRIQEEMKRRMKKKVVNATKKEIKKLGEQRMKTLKEHFKPRRPL